MTALIHLIGVILLFGYGNNYYFHLRMLLKLYRNRGLYLLLIQDTIRTTHTRRGLEDGL